MCFRWKCQTFPPASAAQTATSTQQQWCPAVTCNTKIVTSRHKSIQRSIKTDHIGSEMIRCDTWQIEFLNTFLKLRTLYFLGRKPSVMIIIIIFFHNPEKPVHYVNAMTDISVKMNGWLNQDKLVCVCLGFARARLPCQLLYTRWGEMSLCWGNGIE